MRNICSTALLLNLCLVPFAWAEDSTGHLESNVETSADGSFKGTSDFQGIDASGATIRSKVVKEEAAPAGGKQKSFTTVEVSRDPKGLGNKSWGKGETHRTVDAKGNLHRETKGQSVDAAGTTHQIDEKTISKVAADGATETTVTTKAVTDPKGLMNQSVTKIDVETKRAADGTQTKIVRKEVDGEVVGNTVR